ncbi:MAG: glycosyltransferase [Bacteroidia bacterium]
MIWEILFWFSVACLLHSYFFYPVVLWVLGRSKQFGHAVFSESDPALPTVSILLAAYNEEKVIAEKIRSTFRTSYPHHKIEMLIGSDASTDATNAIIRECEKEFPHLQLVNFPGRTGKAGIINELSKRAKNEVFILTDANVFFEEETIFHLTKHYKEKEITLVGGNILNAEFKKDGISFQEKAYLATENRMKYYEGILWGTMIGAFGGCYSIRRSHYHPVPPRFFMDDFYITMHALEDGGKAVNELEAVCFEDVSNKISEEFRRKVRISIGNFQNLGRFAGLLWPPFTGLSFSFFSHKVLRWLGPFFILVALLGSGMLSGQNQFYRLAFIVQLVLIAIPVLDLLFRKLGLHLVLLRFISHFYLMNLALLTGFLRFIYGVESNIWKPTQRNQ